jgi:hypothetical protein
MSDPPTSRSQAVNALLVLLRTHAPDVQTSTDTMLAEAFLQNLYAWLLDKSRASQDDAHSVNSK